MTARAKRAVGVALTAGHCHAPVDWHAPNREPVASSNLLLWPISQACGAGKSAAVTHVAALAGLSIVALPCGRDTPAASVTAFMQGAVASGVWAVLLNVTSLPRQCVALLAAAVDAVHVASVAGEKQCVVGGVDLPLSSHTRVLFMASVQ